MTKSIEEIYFVKERLRIFESLTKVFDLFHSYNKEKIIPKNFNSQEEVIYAQTNLHIMNLSYAYSFFDNRGIDIRNLVNNEYLSEESKHLINAITKLWLTLEKPITKFRHNYGFHGGCEKQLKSIITASKELDSNNLLPDIAILYNLLTKILLQLESDIEKCSLKI